MKQHEAVVRALEYLGGYAMLGQIYQKALSYSGVGWGTKTPQASIRRILQMRPEFFKIRPGLWGLQARQREILKNLRIDENAKPDQQEAFDHAYYQGVIAEWGKLLRYSTHIPRQDRSKLCAGKPLRSLSSLEDVPPFTYPDLIKRSRTVDVIWFSADSNYPFPVCMFEVEHTTDFHNSLIKFRHFMYFSARFFIVSPSHREKEFRDKLERDHRELDKRVTFLSYDKLVNLYNKDIERQQAYQQAGIALL